MKRLRVLLSVAFIASSVSAQTPAPVTRKKSVKPSPITKDITIIAWVDKSAITLPSGANSDLTTTLNGGLVACSALLAKWEAGDREVVSTDPDRRYANAFLLRNSPNAAPPPTINPDTVENSGDFRLFNRAKVEFFIREGKVYGTPRFIHAQGPVVGATPEPCSGIGLVRVPGDDHANNGARGATTSELIVYQLNEGRIGPDGQAVDRTLNACSQYNCREVPIGPTAPYIWSVAKFDIDGNMISPIDNQIFPTYSVYRNGVKISELPQSDAEIFIAKDADSQRLESEIKTQ